MDIRCPGVVGAAVGDAAAAGKDFAHVGPWALDAAGGVDVQAAAGRETEVFTIRGPLDERWVVGVGTGARARQRVAEARYQSCGGKDCCKESREGEHLDFKPNAYDDGRKEGNCVEESVDIRVHVLPFTL